MLFVDLPPLTVPQGLGVNIHFTDPAPGEMARLAGPFRLARMDFAWGATERTKGVYDFAAYDRLLAAMEKSGVRPYWILDYGNDLYGEGSPRKVEQRDAFCRWVAAAMARFRGHGVVWEMWNEPNIAFWKPKPSVDEYVLLAQAVGATIRRVAPKETLVGPATSGFDWAFLQRCLDAGLLKYWDAVSVHPYRQNEPESVEADWLRLRAMLDRAAPGRNVPMVSGEWGYSEAWSGMTKEEQGEYAARAYLTNLRCGVPISVWYDWKDDGPDPKDAESRFGSVGMDLAPKPAYAAFAKLANDLASYTFVTRLHEKDDHQWLLLFRKGTEARVAAWTTGAPAPALLPGSTVSLTTRPQIVRGPALAPLLKIRPEPWFAMVDGAWKVPGLVLEEETETSFSKIGSIEYGQTTHLVPRHPLDVLVLPARVQDGALLRIGNPLGRDLNGLVVRFRAVREVDKPLGHERDGKVTWSKGKGLKVVELGGFAARPGETPVPKGTLFAQIDAGDDQMGLTRSIPRFADLPLDGATAATDGDPKIRGNASATSTPDGLRLAYDADPGWRFAELRAKDSAVEGRPTAYGVWAKGDGSGANLVMRYTDATGQTFQPGLGRFDDTAWHYFATPIDGSGGHWGGANDGTVHFPIHISTLALIELPDRRGGKAAVLLARPTFAYNK